jgi:hypothetical protein
MCTFPNVCIGDLIMVFKHVHRTTCKNKTVSLRSGGTNITFVILSNTILLLQYSLLFNGYRSTFPEVKQPRRDTDHSAPSIVEVKDEYSYTSTTFVCFYGV